MKPGLSIMPDAKLDGSVIGLSRREKIRILLVYSAIGAATALDFETMGYGIVAIFVVSWLISVVYWRHGDTMSCLGTS